MRPRPSSIVRLDSILDAAEVEFAERGLEAASMRTIAKKAGITAGTIYYHCGGKLELVFEVYTRAIGRIVEEMEQSIAEEKTTERTVERFMERLFHFFVSSPSVPIFILRCSFEAMGDAKKHESLAPLRRVLVRELSSRFERGQIAKVDPETFFSAATGVVLHMVRRLHRDSLLDDEQAVRSAREEATRFIVGALRPTQGVSQATPSYP
jgi:AcrR family transcriptional regulator